MNLMLEETYNVDQREINEQSYIATKERAL